MGGWVGRPPPTGPVAIKLTLNTPLPIFRSNHNNFDHNPKVVIRVLARYGIQGGRDPEHTGVWCVRA